MTNSSEASEKIPNMVLIVGDGADMEEARLLKEKLNVSLTWGKLAEDDTNLVLQLDTEGLALVENGRALRGDFRKMLPRLRQDNLNREMLVKASRIKGVEGVLTAIDATAGLGEDAILLAAAGFHVKLYEYDPVIAALLQNALKRAALIPELSEAVSRMQLFEEDSVTGLTRLEMAPDVIFLDPMFPARQKSALIKKKFQLLQQLEQPCLDEISLVRAAIACGPRKVVIKRPLKGPFLADRKPDYSIKGKAIRYDCIVLPREKTLLEN